MAIAGSTVGNVGIEHKSCAEPGGPLHAVSSAVPTVTGRRPVCGALGGLGRSAGGYGRMRARAAAVWAGATGHLYRDAAVPVLAQEIGTVTPGDGQAAGPGRRSPAGRLCGPGRRAPVPIAPGRSAPKSEPFSTRRLHGPGRGHRGLGRCRDLQCRGGADHRGSHPRYLGPRVEKGSAHARSRPAGKQSGLMSVSLFQRPVPAGRDGGTAVREDAVAWNVPVPGAARVPVPGVRGHALKKVQ